MRTVSTETAPERVVLQALDVWKSYDDGAISVLNGVDFEAGEGESVALCGPSGCGKSTLLHLLGGLDEPDRGRISVNGAELSPHRSRLHLLRHEIGFVFQLHNLIPGLTLEENCLIPTVAAGVDRADCTRAPAAADVVDGSGPQAWAPHSEIVGWGASTNSALPRADE